MGQGSFSIKRPSSKKLSVGEVGGKKSNPIENMIMAFMLKDKLAGAKEDSAKKEMGGNPIVTGATVGGVTYKTAEGQVFNSQEDLRKKSLEKAGKAREAYSKVEGFERLYDKLFSDIKHIGGVQGQQAMLKKWNDYILLKKDPDAIVLKEQFESNLPYFSRTTGEVGNLAEQEQVRQRGTMPYLTPDLGRLSDLGLPDDPVTGFRKLAYLKKIFKDSYDRNLYQYEKGEVFPIQSSIESGTQNVDISKKKEEFIKRQKARLGIK